MIIIGEKLNSSIPKTLEAINKNDTDWLIDAVKTQENCGADFLDINTAICGKNELEKMLMLINLAVENSKCGIMIDSPSVPVVIEAVKAVKDRPIIINSVTLNQRIDELMPVIKEFNLSVVCLPIDKKGIPKTAEQRFENAKLLVEKLSAFGIDKSKIYIDVLVEALSIDDNSGVVIIDTIKKIKEYDKNIKTTCGLSNISYGLPSRISINTAFLSMAAVCGLDSAIMDITSEKMRWALASANLIMGKDEFCMDYITLSRNI